MHLQNSHHATTLQTHGAILPPQTGTSSQRTNAISSQYQQLLSGLNQSQISGVFSDGSRLSVSAGPNGGRWTGSGTLRGSALTVTSGSVKGNTVDVKGRATSPDGKKQATFDLTGNSRTGKVVMKWVTPGGKTSTLNTTGTVVAGTRATSATTSTTPQSHSGKNSVTPALQSGVSSAGSGSPSSSTSQCSNQNGSTPGTSTTPTATAQTGNTPQVGRSSTASQPAITTVRVLTPTVTPIDLPSGGQALLIDEILLLSGPP
jgi:hypothetical protein